MPRRFLLALLLSVVACWAHASGPVVGTPAPAALGMARDGDPVDLQQFRGKIVVVTFWASWCTYCLKERVSGQLHYPVGGTVLDGGEPINPDQIVEKIKEVK